MLELDRERGANRNQSRGIQLIHAKRLTHHLHPNTRFTLLVMYESNSRVPIPPGQPPGIWHELSPGWAGIWHLFKSRYPGHLTPWKNVATPCDPNNMHQYQSRQQRKGLFSILCCNRVSSVKYTKQEQILKILDTMNRRSQFYNVLKYQ